MTHNAKTDQLADFLQFLSEARSFLRKSRVSKHYPDVKRIRSEVEENYHDDRGQPATYQKFESTFYEDAPDIVTLWGFLQNYERSQLSRYHRLTLLELRGLTGDRHPMAIMGRSVLGTAALLLGGVTVWWGIIKLVSEDDLRNLIPELVHIFLSPAWVNRIVGIIMLVGMFVLVLYVIRMVRNRKQVAFLSSLLRSLELYLHDADSQNKSD